MKILFFTLYFPPERGAAQSRTFELTSRLVQLGHEVSVLTTFPNYPNGRIQPEWRGHLFWKGVERGIRVFRVWCYTTPNTGFVKRVLSQLSFAVSACFAAVILPKVDLIVVESHPLFNCAAGLFLSRVKRVPYLLNVSDLWREGAVQIGMLKNRQLIRVCKALEVLFYRQAAAVLAMTKYIKDKIIEEGIDGSKIRLFCNCVDCESFRPGIDGGKLRSAIGIFGDEFMVLYGGTFGLLNNISTILEAAAIFQEQNNRRVRFVLAGEGAYRDKLIASAAARKLMNVKFVGPYEKEQMPNLLNAADCVVVSLADRPVFHGTLPRKLFEAMACGTPIVLAATGESQDLVGTAGAGICVRPEDPEAIHDAIVKLTLQPQEAAAMGVNGCNYARAHFSRDLRVRELTQLAVSVIKRS